MRKFILLSLIAIMFLSCHMEPVIKMENQSINFSISTSSLLKNVNTSRENGVAEYTLKVIAKNRITNKTYSTQESFSDLSPRTLKLSLKIPTGEDYTIGVYLYQGDNLLMADYQENCQITSGNNSLSLSPNESKAQAIDIIGDKKYFKFESDYVNFSEEPEYSIITTSPQTEEKNIYIWLYESDGNYNASVYSYLRWNSATKINITTPSGKTISKDYKFEEYMSPQSVWFSYNFSEEGLYKISFTLTDDTTGVTKEISKYVNVGSQTVLYRNDGDNTMTLQFTSDFENETDPVSSVIDYTFANDGSVYYLYKNPTDSKYFIKNSLDSSINKNVTTYHGDLSEIAFDKAKNKLYVTSKTSEGNTGNKLQIPHVIEIKLDANEDTWSDGQINGDDQLNHYTMDFSNSFESDVLFTAADNDKFYALYKIQGQNQYALYAYDITSDSFKLNQSVQADFVTYSSLIDSTIETIINDFVVHNKQLYITYSQRVENGDLTHLDYNYGGLVVLSVDNISKQQNIIKNDFYLYVPLCCKDNGEKYSIYDFGTSTNPYINREDSWKNYLWKENLSCPHSTLRNSEYFLEPRRIIGVSGMKLLFADCGNYIGTNSEKQVYYQKQQNITAFSTQTGKKIDSQNTLHYDFGENIIPVSVRNGGSYPNTATYVVYRANDTWITPTFATNGSRMWDIIELDDLFE